MDPQHRLFLECAWQAFEDAGHVPDQFPGLIGVFAAAAESAYAVENIARSDGYGEFAGDLQVFLGNGNDFLPSRLSYLLNLQGPSMVVKTACSSSLVAVHLACQSLLNYECDMALAGGVSLLDMNRQGYVYQEGGIYSPDGFCRAFDARAAGTVRGNGIGLVVLRRLEDALADGNSISALIRGSAVNNDGRSKVGYTAPGVEGQAAVIAEALNAAGVEPQSISYVEAHGTGTALGDPIEVEALTQAFRSNTDEKGFCALGSLKTNIGHLNTAAGVAGLLKVVLSLKHRQLPPSLNFEKPNPKIRFEDSPFFVNTRLRQWTTKGPRRAGVSSFGIGGTNAHAILEEAPATHHSATVRPWHVLVISAMNREALEQASAALARAIQRGSLDTADVAFTLQSGRRHMGFRRTLVCRDLATAARSLEAGDPYPIGQVQKTPDLVFLFPGQGTQTGNMARDLYRTEPLFAAELDRCDGYLKNRMGFDLKALLLQKDPAAGLLDRTDLTQPALFAVEYAMAQLWLSWGVKPQAMLGHSIGEYVAACLAGVFSLPDALVLMVVRGRLFQEGLPGAMLATSLSEAQVRPYLGDEVQLAAVNGPFQTVLSGTQSAIAKLEVRLKSRNIAAKRLKAQRAFHSAMCESFQEAFGDAVARCTLRAPKIPFISNVTGTWITDQDAQDPQYWVRHMGNTVRFDDGLAVLVEKRRHLFLEVGPGQTLNQLVRKKLGRSRSSAVVSSLAPGISAEESMAIALADVWRNGVEVDWDQLYGGENRLRVPLPTYPFQRRRFWLSPQTRATQKKRSNLADWLYQPSWKRKRVFSRPADSFESRVLLFSSPGAHVEPLAARLEALGHQVVTICWGSEFSYRKDGDIALNPLRPEDYEQLFARLDERSWWPTKVIHLGSLDEFAVDGPVWESNQKALDNGFFSLLFTVQSLSRRRVDRPVEILVVSSQGCRVLGDEALVPEKLALAGLCRVIPQEFPNLRCRQLDVEGSGDVDAIVAEANYSHSNALVAYRNRHRWVAGFEPAPVPEAPCGAGLRRGGVYWITGGLGRVGLVLATHLARQLKAKLILSGRSAMPPRDQWSSLKEQPQWHAKVSALLAMEAAGAEVSVLQCDVTQDGDVAFLLEQTETRFGALNGVVHAAGDIGSRLLRPITRTDPDHCRRQLAPKVEGLRVLARHLSGKDLDFVMTTSSLSTVLGGLGLAAYSAANHVMDGLSTRLSSESGVPWMSVNWDGWDFDSASASPFSLKPHEGVSLFQRLVAWPEAGQTIVSSGDLNERLARLNGSDGANRYQSGTPLRNALENQGGSSDFGPLGQERPGQERPGQERPGHERPGHERPADLGPYRAPDNDLEKAVVAIWEPLFGIDGIGTHDDFFQLGGDSLLATQLVGRIRNQLKVPLTIDAVFRFPTAAAQAREIQTLETVAPSSVEKNEETVDLTF